MTTNKDSRAASPAAPEGSHYTFDDRHDECIPAAPPAQTPAPLILVRARAIETLKRRLAGNGPVVGDSPEGVARSAIALLELWQARAEHPAPAAWQPIETAPRETWILVGGWEGDHFTIAESMSFLEYGNEMEGEPRGPWLVWASDYHPPEEPTHWMPLPAAPTGGKP